MSKSAINKIRLLFVLALVIVISIYAGYYVFAKAQPTVTSIGDITTFQMDGAGLFHNDEKDGLQFTASMSLDEYEGVMALGNVKTGLIIAPTEYSDRIPFTKENFFGTTAKYDWAEYDQSIDNPDYVYQGSNSTAEKVRVININANDWQQSGNKYVYSGAIVDVLSDNLDRSFSAFSYLELDGEYLLTNVVQSSIGLEIRKLDQIPTWVPKEWVDASLISEYTVKFNLVSTVGSNQVVCTYNGNETVADVKVPSGSTLSGLVSAVPHLKYSDDYKFDKWVYIDVFGNAVTITKSTVFSTEIFKERTIIITAQCKRTPYGPVIS